MAEVTEIVRQDKEYKKAAGLLSKGLIEEAFEELDKLGWIKQVPDAILRSPAPVVRAFLRAYFDCDGYAGRQGVILSTSSDSLASTVQLLLLNFGILSSRRPHKDGC